MSSTNVTVPVGNGFYESDSVPFSNQRCVNLYPNIPETQALEPIGLFGTEGLRQVASTGVTPTFSCRGAIEFQGKAYFANGDGLFRVDKTIGILGNESYEATFLGNIDGAGRVSMAENGTQIMIVTNTGKGWIYDPLAMAVTEITDAGFAANGTPQIVEYVDRYFIVTTDEKKAIISAVGDGTNWNAIDFISAEADPDEVVAPFIHKNQLYLLGRITTEQFQNIGGAGVPFQRVNGYVVPVGCSSKFSVINVGGTIFWIGRKKNQLAAIWAFDGGEPQKVSTVAVDNKLAELTEEELSDVYSFAYGQRGNTFVHFTTANETLVFNITTGRWHERESIVTVSEFSQTIPCRISHAIEVYNDLLVGDVRDGRIGIIDINEYTEYGEDYVSYFTTQPIKSSGNDNSFTLPKVELSCETGVGNDNVAEPVVRMQIARDGMDFGDSRTRSLGTRGSRNVRPIWHKVGRVDTDCALKFTISDAVKRRIYAIKLRLKGSIYG